MRHMRLASCKGRAAVHVLLWLSIGAVIAFVLWTRWAMVDEITRAPGQVITTSRNQVIQAPPSGGVVEAILVREGSTVKRGQLLVRFERPRVQATVDEVAGRCPSRNPGLNPLLRPFGSASGWMSQPSLLLQPTRLDAVISRYESQYWKLDWFSENLVPYR